MKRALLGTRYPRKEKEDALQNVTGEPACLYGNIVMPTRMMGTRHLVPRTTKKNRVLLNIISTPCFNNHFIPAYTV